ILTPPPDLRVDSLRAPDNAFSGQNITVQWKVVNAGPGPTEANEWFDAVFFSQDSVLNQKAVQIGTAFRRVGALQPGGSYNGSVSGQLPHAVMDTSYLFVVTDVSNNVFEFALENNNTRKKTIAITLAPPPDLVVTQISNPSTGNSGQAILVGWTVENQGPGSPFEAGWSDRVYLSESPTFSPEQSTVLGSVQRSAPFNPGAKYSVQRNLTLPNGISGMYYIFVHTDWANQVFEHTFENNNVLRSDTTIAISLSPWPDLQVVTIQTPNNAVAGNRITISWTVANAGKGIAAPAPWTDRLLLASDPSTDPTRARFLAEGTRIQPLDTAKTYTQTTTVDLPVDISGNYYILVQTDARNN
ncbi:MAG: hypothetical protein L0287_14265, partial [Anaerolineae bacterium]|nr:hypothetical protein [Anaerolineae bacterium]